MAPDGLVLELMAAQSSDGGWGYRGNSTSWTEPTCLAILALDEIPHARAVVARAREWLRCSQRSDGGWAPRPDVDQSVSVTALALLSLGVTKSEPALTNGAAWLVAQSGQGFTNTQRLFAWLLGQKRERIPQAWAWFPGTASWVIPTAFSILALQKLGSVVGGASTATRLAQGREFLLSRQCAGGGWNHGGSSIGSEGAQPYPDTTGIALLALNGVYSERLQASLERGEHMYRSADSVEGRAWLRLGLCAHGRTMEPVRGNTSAARTTVAMAVELIATRPTNPFLPRSNS